MELHQRKKNARKEPRQKGDVFAFVVGRWSFVGRGTRAGLQKTKSADDKGDKGAKAKSGGTQHETATWKERREVRVQSKEQIFLSYAVENREK